MADKKTTVSVIITFYIFIQLSDASVASLDISNISNITTTFVPTNHSTTSEVYTSTVQPTTSPTWSPTIDGEFPYIHYVQSLIACGTTIDLSDEFGSQSYAEFTTLESIDDVDILFVVCKSTSTFHPYDALDIWFGDTDNSTDWNLLTLPSDPSIYCSTFYPSNAANSLNFSVPQTYFIGLNRYEQSEDPNDYGQYTIYMDCDAQYNEYLDDFNISNEDYITYTQPHFDESDLVSDISCGITVTDYVSTTDFFGSSNRILYYRFTVISYTEWIDIYTCDNTKKSHSISLHYTHGGNTWESLTRSVSPSTCSRSSFPRFYDLIPGRYYIGISIHNLQYNHYTVGMNCSSSGMDTIETATDYTPYIPSVPSPTGFPTARPTEDSDDHSKISKSNAGSYGLVIAIVLVLITLGLGIYFGRKRYKKRERVHRKKRKSPRMKARSRSSGDLKAKMSPKRGREKEYESQEKDESRSFSSTVEMAEIEDGCGNGDDEDIVADPQCKTPEEGMHVSQPSEGAEGIAIAAIAAPVAPAANGDNGKANEFSDIAPAAVAYSMESSNHEHFESGVAAPAAFQINFGAVPVPVVAPTEVMTIEDPYLAAPSAHEAIAVENGAEAEAEAHTEAESETESESNSFELPMEQFEFQKGSYVTIGGSGGTFGIILKVLDDDMVSMIDLFERRKCQRHQNTLVLIQEPEKLEKAKLQYEKFKRRQQRARSRGKK